MSIFEFIFVGVMVWSIFNVYDEGYFVSHPTPIGVFYRLFIPIGIIYLIFFN